MHDRQVEGETFVFGNQGGLFLNAMTWYDHKTDSVWSQVWGQAIAGPLKGTTLELIPASIVPLGTWRQQHPQTLAMTSGKDVIFSREEPLRDGWVAGIAIGEYSKAYQFQALIRDGVVNDIIGPYPVVIYADSETRTVQAYLRQVDDQVLTFSLDETGTYLIDAESNTRWDAVRGLGREGVYQEQALLQVPYLSSFDWAWLDFYPNSEFYE